MPQYFMYPDGGFGFGLAGDEAAQAVPVVAAVADPLEEDRLAAIRKFQVPESQWPKNIAIQRMLAATIDFDHPILFGVDFQANGFQDQMPRSINEGTTDLGGPYAAKAA